jgi:hypothetical protein
MNMVVTHVFLHTDEDEGKQEKKERIRILIIVHVGSTGGTEVVVEDSSVDTP